MLTRIEIRDFALIERIIMEPGRGLLIMTGETGAGKSILIDAISVLSGGRVARDMVRHGQSSATVEAVFQVWPGLLPAGLAADLGLIEEPAGYAEPEAGEGAAGQLQTDPEPADIGTVELILSREIAAGGKSSCRINGRLSSLAVLRDLAACLIDIHGQHDQQAIFKVDSHLQMLDRYAGQSVSQAHAAYLELQQQHQACQKEIRSLGSDPAERARQIDLLAYQVEEILSAAARPGEDETLANRQRILAHAEKIQSDLAEGYEHLAGDRNDAVLAGIGAVLANLESIQRQTDELDDIAETIINAQDILQTAASDLRSARELFESDPGERSRIDERLDLLYRLKKKYGGSLPAVAEYLNKASNRLEQLSGGEERYGQLMAEKDRLKQLLQAAARRLSDGRRQAATGMEQKIAHELADLGMKGVRFSVQFADLKTDVSVFPDQGLDQVEFLLSANPGEPLRPLARIASGGEASRIMLAIKTILAGVDQMPVLIFDEIDTGVSGQTTGKVGEKLMQLAQGRQIFCITHMAQIAAMADEHWLIEKQVQDGRTRTGLRQLLDLEREMELARLLSGGIADQTARQLAGQLRLQADSLKGRLQRT